MPVPPPRPRLEETRDHRLKRLEQQPSGPSAVVMWLGVALVAVALFLVIYVVTTR